MIALLSLAFAAGDTPDPRGEDRALTIIVQDADGRPLPGWLRFDGVDEPLRTNTANGAWTGSRLYRDEGERTFHPGDVLKFEAFAAGHSLEPLVYVVGKKRKNVVMVQLAPQEPWTLTDADPQIAHQAVDGWSRWAEAERALGAVPTEEAQAHAEALRAETAAFARGWVDAGGGERAVQLCRMTGPASDCGR